MSHALIVDDNMIVGRAIQDRLIPLGFDSFDHTWTHDQAIAAAGSRQPDLVIVGDTIASGSPLDVARSISTRFDTPVLMVSADISRARERTRDDASFEGPFRLDEIERAVLLARSGDQSGLPTKRISQSGPK